MNKNRKNLLLLLLLFLPIMLFSYTSPSGSIKGKVIDNQNQKPLPYATISLLNLPDTQLVTGTLSSNVGTFEFNDIELGKYLIRISFVSYTTYTSKIINLIQEKPQFNVGEVSLAISTRELSTVEISAERSQMQLSLDKRVYNVSKDLTNAGGSAEDILNNVPSVEVDIDGNVNLRGSGNVRILIDGKPSGMVGSGSGSGLRQIQANMIERIEVITNPSAKYDAEGQAGIINIILKKEKREGFNGAFDVNLGYPGNLGAAFNLNYRKKWINVFTNYAIGYRRNPGRGFGEQEFRLADSTFFTTRERAQSRGGISNTIRLGTDIYPKENHVITGSFLYKTSNEKNYSTIQYNDFNALKIPIGTTNRYDNELELDNDLEWSLSYKKEYKNDKQSLTADIKYIQSGEIEDSDIEETLQGISKPLFQSSYNSEREAIILSQIDYSHPFSKKGIIETGYRSNLRNINNSFLVEEQDDEGEWMRLNQFSNRLNYTENIHAAYFSFGNEKGKLGYKLGLRSEYSQIETHLIETNQKKPRDYLNLFPTAHFTLKSNDKNQWQLSYSRRINRPRFRDLNPFYSFTDNRNYYSGNPNLDPEYTHSFESGYLKYIKNGTLYGGLYYRMTTGVFERIAQVQSDGLTITMPVNLSERDDYGFEFNYSHQITKKWSTNANVNIFYQEVNGNYNDVELSSEAFTASGRINTRVSLWKGIDGQGSFNYRAPRRTTQGRNLSFYTLDLGFSKDALKEKATWSLSVRDLFNTRMRRSITEGDNFYSYSEFQWRSREIILTFTYRINRKKTPEGRGKGSAPGDDSGDF